MKLGPLGILAALLSVGVFSCPLNDPREPRVGAAPTRRTDTERLKRLVLRVRDVERRARALGSTWTQVRSGYVRAQQAFTAAEVAYQRAARSSEDASKAFSEAREAWDQARWRWKLYQQLVHVAAAIDAHNLDRFRALTGSQVDSLDCSSGLSVSDFRALLIGRGVDLTGKDIDHIVPRSLGGADHPANYQVIDSSLNRSLQDDWGPGKCRMAGNKCPGAIAMSRKCGTYEGPEF